MAYGSNFFSPQGDRFIYTGYSSGAEKGDRFPGHEAFFFLMYQKAVLASLAMNPAACIRPTLMLIIILIKMS